MSANLCRSLGVVLKPQRLARTQQGRDTQNQENGRSDPMNNGDRHPVGNAVTEDHRRHIGDHHAQRGASGDGDHVAVMRGQRDGGDLSLVADFHEKERHKRGEKYAARAGLFGALISWRTAVGAISLFGDGETIRVECPRCAAGHTLTREAMEAYLVESGKKHA